MKSKLPQLCITLILSGIGFILLLESRLDARYSLIWVSEESVGPLKAETESSVPHIAALFPGRKVGAAKHMAAGLEFPTIEVRRVETCCLRFVLKRPIKASAPSLFASISCRLSPATCAAPSLIATSVSPGVLRLRRMPTVSSFTPGARACNTPDTWPSRSSGRSLEERDTRTRSWLECSICCRGSTGGLP